MSRGLREAACCLVLVCWPFVTSAEEIKPFDHVDRTDMHNAGRAVTSCYLHVFTEGERVVELSPLVADKPTHLRLARRGERVTAAYSQDDGKAWRELKEHQVALPDKVKVGVAALNNTNRPCKVRFEEFKLSK